MNAEQLKALAAGLRALLARWDIAISHGQALDLLAALPGLRDWPEVNAFPDRLAAQAIDLAATGRLARRVASKFGPRLPPRVARRLDAAELMNELAPWTLTEPRDSGRRERLIVASGDSATGCLRRAQIADRVETAALDLAWGPVPMEDDPARFTAARLAAWDTDPATSDQPEPWKRTLGPDELDAHDGWMRQLPAFAEYARIELWADPDPNSQLQLLQLLDWLRRQDALAGRVFLMQSATPLGQCRPFDVRTLQPRFDPVGPREYELAARAWRAFREPTPRPWSDLLTTNLDALPRLRDAVRLLLAELPAADTGLRASERRILERVAQPDANFLAVIASLLSRHEPARVFGYWPLGRLLAGLAHGPRPAVEGLLDGPFDLALHGDSRRLRHYQDSPLRLTPFGQAVLRGEADIGRERPARFWWGGTKLTPERPWRWDATLGRLEQ
jgi:hypothetical protein